MRQRKRVATFLLQPFDLLVPKRGLEDCTIYPKLNEYYFLKIWRIRFCIHFFESFAFSSPVSLAHASAETRPSARLRLRVCVWSMSFPGRFKFYNSASLVKGNQLSLTKKEPKITIEGV